MDNQAQLSIEVTVQNREKILFDGTAKAVTSINEKGVFDILPQHSNFITVVHDYILIHLIDGSDKRIPCRQGVLWVTSNVVKVAIDIIPSTKKVVSPAAH